MNEPYLIGHIYILLFPNGKRYAGQTVRTVEERIKEHWCPPKRERNLPVHNAMRKYGKEGVKTEKVFIFKCTQEYLDLIEDRAIEHFNTRVPYGYNLKEGGFGGAHSEETKRKMSISHMGKRTHTQKHSEETKARISAKVSAYRLGRPSPRKGMQTPEEVKRKISATKRAKQERKV